MNIINLIMFCTRTMTEEEQQQMRTWMPVDTDHIPLQDWDPSLEGQLVMTTDEEDSA